MYAVIRTGGKQYKVQAGDVVQVEKLEQKLGAEFTINEVLMVGGESVLLGQPLVSGASVTVVVTRQAKDRKKIVFKKKRRQGYRKFATHRQEFTELFVKAITAGGKSSKTDATPNVIDMNEKRAAQQQARLDAKAARLQRGPATAETAEAAPKKVAKKKVAKKAVKKTVKKASKSGAKKKAAKKTSKKA